MSKPIQEDIFKSRLTITYRTNISGTPQEERLPFRLLVLGEFEGAHERAVKGIIPALAERKIGSIHRGTSVKNHMREIEPTWAIPDSLKVLQSYVPGHVTFRSLKCLVPKSKGGDGESSCSFTGEAVFESHPNENGNLGILEGALSVSGKATVARVKGQPSLVEGGSLTLLGTASGKLVAGASNGNVDIATALIHVTTKLSVEDFVLDVNSCDDSDPRVDGYDVRCGKDGAAKCLVKALRTVPFTSVNCFSPDDVVQSIPELRRLRVIKGLVLELQAMLRNRAELRERLKTLLPKSSSDEECLKTFKELRAWAQSELKLLQWKPQLEGVSNG